MHCLQTESASPDLGACRWCVQGIVWEQRELSLVQQVAQAEKATLSASRMEDDLASLRADLRLREQVRTPTFMELCAWRGGCRDYFSHTEMSKP